MKPNFLIQTNGHTFLISKSIADLLKKSSSDVPVHIHAENLTFVLSSSILCTFQLVETKSSTHFYILVGDKKVRVSRKFFTYLNSLLKKEEVIETSSANNLDQFYTKPKIAESCVLSFLNNVHISQDDLIIEPSAGDGSFVEHLTRVDCKKFFFDIAPKNNLVQKVDFFKWQPALTKGKIHVIGNPPFGKNSKDAINFFNHAAGFADTISFIMPRTFSRESMQNKLSLNFSLNHFDVLPLKSFIGADVRCSFYIWKKELTERKKQKRITFHDHFSFAKPNGSFDFCIRSAGRNCGLIKTTGFNQLTHGSFLRVKSHINVNALISRLNQLDYSSCFENISIPHLTQHQLIKLYNIKFPSKK